MTQAHRRRLEALERRQPKGPVRRDSFDAAMRLWVDLQAVAAGKACWVPRPASEWSEETAAAFDLAMRDADCIADRLQAERKAG